VNEYKIRFIISYLNEILLDYLIVNLSEFISGIIPRDISGRIIRSLAGYLGGNYVVKIKFTPETRRHRKKIF